MTFCRNLKLYLWKNSLQKRRHWIVTSVEILCPAILTALMMLLYVALSAEQHAAQVYVSTPMSGTAYTLQSAAYQLQDTTFKIAMSPAGADLDDFIAKMDAVYPAVNLADLYPAATIANLSLSSVNMTLPAFSNAVKKFKDNAELNDYIKAAVYDEESAESAAIDKVWVGIHFNSFGPDWDYTIRYNVTEIIQTDEDEMNLFRRSVNYNPTRGYYFKQGSFGGRGTGNNQLQNFTSFMPSFATFQTALDKVIINKPATKPVSMQEASKYLQGLLTGTIGVDKLTEMQRNDLLSAFDPAHNPGLINKLAKPLGLAPQGVNAVMFPTPAYETHPFYTSAIDVFSFFFVLTYLLPVSRLVRGIVFEKEERIQEGMKMMGMSSAALNLAWFITYWTVFTIVALLVTVLTIWNIFGRSNFLLVFLLFTLFGFASTTFCYMLSAFFSRSKTASVVGMVLFFGSFFPFFALDADSSPAVNALSSLCAPVALGLGLNIGANFENDGVGITFNTVGISFNNFSVASAMLMLFVDTLLYFILGWYLNNVLPSEFGLRRPFYFPFTKSYWTGKAEDEGFTAGSVTPALTNANVEKPTADLVALEDANRCLKIRGLVKKFATPDGVKTAVNNLDLTMYEGQIFALLGHNGAGKTTTISMLSGLLAPSAGEATIFGKSIAGSMGELRKSMGVCPQHNVLFDDLTVKEHLQYFAGLKGMDPTKVAGAVEKMIKSVGLTEKVNTRAGQLSGGQKRKLSVSIALIGDSKIVFLDEPTSGMDPYSRRSTWNVLQNSRAGRIIILTTHFMDEADLLGDRIGIMANGSIRCCGSPMYLKHRYGVGYSLTAVKKPDCDPDKLCSIISKHVPNNKILSDVGAEIAFQLPLAASASFPDMLSELDAGLEDLQLETYGISVTTMEEVFLKVAHDGDEAAKRPAGLISKRVIVDDDDEDVAGAAGAGVGAGAAAGAAPAAAKVSERRNSMESIRKAAGRSNFCGHFYGLMAKRLLFGMRDRKSLIFQMVIPPLAIILGMWLLTDGAPADQPDLPLSTHVFNLDEGLAKLTPYADYGNATTILNHIPSANASLVAVSNVMSYFNKSGLAAAGLPASMHQWEAFSEYLLETRSSNAASRFGAYDLASNIGSSGLDATMTLFVNSTAVHAAPIYQSLASSALLQQTEGDGSIAVHNYPLPWTNRQSTAQKSVLAMFVSLIIVFAFAFIPAAFIVFVVKEKAVAAKHQQLISGVSIPAYWVSTWCYDMLVYLVPGLIAVVAIAAFDVTEFVEDGSFGPSILLITLYGPASAGFAYMCSYLFKSHGAAQNAVLLVNVLSVILLLVSFIMGFIPSTQDTDEVLRYFYRLLPGFCLGEGFMRLATKILLQAIFNSADLEAWDMDVTGWPLLYMALETVIYFLLAIGIDYMLSYPSIRAKLSHDPVVQDAPYEDDEDVKREQDRIAAGENPNDAIVVKELRKVYPSNKKVAVKNLSFGIRRGECFGYLGINGAGKTTTLQVLSGDAIPSSGSASLLGFDIMSQQAQVRRLLGYCPQFEALLELLTTREHLELYARIKSVPKKKLKAKVQQLLEEMDLVEYENKLAGSLSGGNKRKLSVAIAMMGDPPLMFLDEPSTGMDPVARRFMWKIIARLAKRSSIVLVSHSMEECEALCNRVGIMVGGRLRCLGSVQHLKHRFGRGFLSEIKLADPSPSVVNDIVALCGGNAEMLVDSSNVISLCEKLGDKQRYLMIMPDRSGWMLYAGFQSAKKGVTLLDFAKWWAAETAAARLTEFMKRAFPGVSADEPTELTERHGSRLRFKVGRQSIPMGKMFGLVETVKEELCIEEYSFSQTSLEQIFNFFAAQQEEEKGQVAGMETAGVSQVAKLCIGTTIPGFGAISAEDEAAGEGNLDAAQAQAVAAAGVGAGAGEGATAWADAEPNAA